MHGDAVDAVADLSVRVRNVAGAQSLVDRPPRLAGVLSPEDPCRRNRAEHPFRVAWVDQDGVQTQSAGARRPARRGLVGPEALQLVPGLAGIACLEDGRVLDARVNRVRI